jgi:hypothetical protein
LHHRMQNQFHQAFPAQLQTATQSLPLMGPPVFFPTQYQQPHNIIQSLQQPLQMC